jgi:hypothetical protein
VIRNEGESSPKSTQAAQQDKYSKRGQELWELIPHPGLVWN